MTAVGNFFSKIYGKAEEGFYQLMDAVENRGIPVYNYVEFVEKKGVPAFPFTVGIILVLLFLVSFFVIMGSQTITITPAFGDEDGVLNQVNLQIVNARDETIFDAIIDSQTPIDVTGKVHPGESVTLTATREGYSPTTRVIDQVTPGDNTVSVRFVQPAEYITAFVVLKDADTATIIKDAEVEATISGEVGPVVGVIGTDGRFSLAALPKGKPVSLVIKPKNYDDPGVISHTFYDDEEVLPISLAPKAELAAKTSTLSVNVTDGRGTLMTDAIIQLFDAQTNTRITNDVLGQGVLHQELKNGTAVRVVVSKEGYRTYDSALLNENKTLRNAEESWNIVLVKGGETVRVLVKSANGEVVTDAQVMLWNDTFEIVDGNETGFSGGITFSGLDKNNGYTISAFKENYLSVKKTLEFGKENVLVLQEATIQNSAFVTITVQDEFGSVVSNAKLLVLEQTGSTLVPIGIPIVETDVTGVISIRAPIGASLFIAAMKEGSEGSATTTVVAQGSTISIILVKDPTVKTIRVTDLGGTELASGRVTVTCTDGSLIFDGNLEANGRASFDAGNCKEGLLHIEANARVQDIPVNFQGQPLINIVFEGKDVSGFAPQVTFIGIQNEAGEELPGLARDSDAYLVFSIDWPQGDYTGGLHVRVGDDSVKNALSQPVTIQGFSSNANEIVFGKTYNAPNNSSIDLQNTTTAGEPAKWVNASWNHPLGTTIVKVKVHATSQLSKGSVAVHYRAFIDAFGKFYRNPTDEVIGLNAGVESRHGLYAKTLEAVILTFEGQLQSCNQNVCLYLAVTDSSGNQYEWNDFYASVGKTYFLNATVSAKKSGAGTLLAQVEPIGLIGLGTWSTTVQGIVPGFLDSNGATSNSPITINAGQIGTWGLGFAALKEGSVKMRVSATLDGESTIESRAFLVSLDRKTKVTISPNPGRVGDKIQFTIKSDDNRFTPAENATIIFKDTVGNEVYRLVGNGTSQKGKAGRYVIPAVLKAGTYEVTVTGKGFETQVIPFEIAVDDALVFSGDAYVKIPNNTRNGNASVNLVNQTPLMASEITYQVTGLDQFKDFLVSVNGPSVISASESGEVRLSATYNGKETNTRANGTLEAIGQLEDGTLTIAKIPISIEFNPKLDPSCLEIVPSDLKATLFSESGSEKQVPITLRNNCSTDPLELLSLTVRVSGNASPNEISVSTPDATVAGGEEKVVSLLVTNRIDRQAVERQTVEFLITFSDASITKSVPLHVELISKRLALSFPNTITVYVSQTIRGQAEEVVAPFTVKNASNVPIQNLSFTLRSGSIEGVAMSPSPAIGIPTLNPGQTVPAFINIHSDVEKSKIVKDELIIRGSVDGKSYDLGRINVIVNASSPSCLRANVTKLNFQSEISDAGIGFESEQVTLQNNCGQEVQIIDVTPRGFGANTITLQPADNFVLPVIPIGGVARYKVLLTKQQSMKTTGQMFITGLLLSPQLTQSGFKRVTTDPIPVNIDLGSTVGEDTLSESETELPVCEDVSKKILVKFPKIAQSGDSCSTSYCDASQAAVFLLDKIQKMYNTAESKLLEKNNSTLGTGCANQAACDLSEFGVDNESFLIYLQNDFVTPEIIEQTIEKNDRFSSLRGFDTILGSLPGFGFGRSIVLPEMKGCGKYSLELTGAVETVGINVQPGRETFSVRIKSDRGRVVTKECEARIQNAANFLPTDNPASGGSRTYRDRQGSWMAMVDSTPELSKEAQAISQTLFGSKDRYQNGSSNVNTIYVSTDPSVSRLVKVSLENGVVSGPVRINATINDDVFTKDKSQVAGEVGQILAALKNKNPAAGSCIGQDQTYMGLVAGDSKLGGLPQVSECRVDFVETVGQTKNPTTPKIPFNELRLTGGTEQCCTFTVTGVSRTQKIMPQLSDGSYSDPRNPSVLGVQGIPTIKEKQSKADVTTQSGGYELNAVPKVVDGKNVSVFERDFQLCATGDETTFDQLAFQKGQNVYIIATDLTGNGSGEKLDSQAREVSVNVCGIHPYDLMERLIDESAMQSNAGTGKVFLATVVWEGDPNPVQLRALLRKMDEDSQLRPLFDGHYISSGGQIIAGNRTGNIQVGSGQLKSIGVYFGVCMVSHLVLDAVTGVIKTSLTGGAGAVLSAGSALSSGFDCGVPAGFAAYESYKGIGNEEDFEAAAEEASVGLIDTILELTGFDEPNENMVQIGTEAGITRGIVRNALNVYFGSSSFFKGTLKKVQGFFNPELPEPLNTTELFKDGKYPSDITIAKEVRELDPLKVALGNPSIPGPATGLYDRLQIAEGMPATNKTELAAKESALNRAEKAIVDTEAKIAKLEESIASKSAKIDSAIDQLTEENKRFAELQKKYGKTIEKDLPTKTTMENRLINNDNAIAQLKQAKSELAAGRYANAKVVIESVAGKAKGTAGAVSAIGGATSRTAAEIAADAVKPSAILTPTEGSLRKFARFGAGLIKDIGIAYLSNVAGAIASRKYFESASVKNGIELNAGDDTTSFSFLKYHTYQINMNYAGSDKKPVWNIQKVASDTVIPKDAIVLPETCDYTAFDRGLSVSDQGQSANTVLPQPAP